MLPLGASMASLGWSHVPVVAGGSWPSFLSPSLAQRAATSLHMSEAQASLQTREGELQAAECSPSHTQGSTQGRSSEQSRLHQRCRAGVPRVRVSVLTRPLEGAACALNVVGCALTGRDGQQPGAFPGVLGRVWPSSIICLLCNVTTGV